MLLSPSPHSTVPSDPTDGSICHPGTVSCAGLSCRLWLVTPGFPTEARLSEHRCHLRSSQAGHGQAWLSPRPPLEVPRASALSAQSLSTSTRPRRLPAVLNPHPHAAKLPLTRGLRGANEHGVSAAQRVLFVFATCMSTFSIHAHLRPSGRRRPSHGPRAPAPQSHDGQTCFWGPSGHQRGADNTPWEEF